MKIIEVSSIMTNDDVARQVLEAFEASTEERPTVELELGDDKVVEVGPEWIEACEMLGSRRKSVAYVEFEPADVSIETMLGLVLEAVRP
jgi:hypothetical protein